MLTIRADILKEKPKKDGSFNIRIRFTHNRKVKRLPTKLYATKEDLTRSFDFKENTSIKREVDNLLFYYEKLCSQIPVDIEQCTIKTRGNIRNL